jgi:hypothetical protein
LSSHDPEERRRIARLGGLTAAASGALNTSAAYAGRWAKYLARVDNMADAPLSEAERQRRAEALMRADMIRLSRRAVEKRRQLREAREAREADARHAADVAIRRAERAGIL